MGYLLTHDRATLFVDGHVADLPVMHALWSCNAVDVDLREKTTDDIRVMTTNVSVYNSGWQWVCDDLLVLDIGLPKAPADSDIWECAPWLWIGHNGSDAVSVGPSEGNMRLIMKGSER